MIADEEMNLDMGFIMMLNAIPASLHLSSDSDGRLTH
jgi:hypothetical protein